MPYFLLRITREGRSATEDNEVYSEALPREGESIFYDGRAFRVSHVTHVIDENLIVVLVKSYKEII